MIRKIIVDPWSPDFVDNIEYDVFISTIGYESRARFVAQKIKPKAKRRIAVAFNENKELDYFRNLNWYKKSNYETPEYTNDDFKTWSYEIAKHINSGKNLNRHILIDISSMSRFRIASLVYSFVSSPGIHDVTVDYIYALAKYNSPPASTGPITSRGPVLSEFAGWFEDPGAPSSVIVGMGYDLGKAVSTIEYIEPGQIFALFPRGEDDRYDRSVEKANKLLLDSLDNNRIINYDVMRSYDTFQSLRSLVSGVLRSSKLIIVPFGPKIFTLLSLIIALYEFPKVSVWRVSSGKYEKVANRLASGNITGLRVKYLSKS